MRVIGGIAKGRKLVSPSGLAVRPTPAKARGAVFDILGQKIIGAHVLDLFCGSGAMGIEALSRGAESAVFVDHDRGSLACVRRNLEKTGFAANSRVLRRRVPEQLNNAVGSSFSLIISDPPYGSSLVTKLAVALATTSLTARSVTWAHESSSRDPEITADDTPGWSIESRRRYGDTAITILRRARD